MFVGKSCSSWHLWDIVYYGISQKEQNKLQRLQNGACRIILTSGSQDSVTGMHKELILDKLDLRRNKHICCQLYRCRKGLVPHAMSSKIQEIGENYTMTTRAKQGNVLETLRARLAIGIVLKMYFILDLDSGIGCQKRSNRHLLMLLLRDGLEN